MSLTTTLLSSTVRAANVLSSTAAEAQTAAAGWALNANITSAVAGTVPGPFGYGLNTVVTTGAGGSGTLTIAAGTFAAGYNTVSVFVRPGSSTAFTLNLRDTTNSISHQVTFNFAGGAWTVGTPTAGATGAVLAATYDNSWVRVAVSFVVGAPGGGATAAGSARSIIIVTSVSTTFETWGVLVEDSASAPLPALPLPYLTGLGVYNDQSLVVLNPQRVKDASGLCQVSMTGTPDAKLALQGRATDAAPWVTIASWVEGDMIATTMAVLTSVYPQMRVLILELNNTTTTLGAWITE